jgi:CheY-like chemotaxis protein
LARPQQPARNFMTTLNNAKDRDRNELGVKPRLLIVDDNADFCDAVRVIAEGEGYEVLAVQDGENFMAAYGSFDPGHIILDLSIPDHDGLELMRFLANQGCAAEIVIASSHNENLLRQARQLAETYGLKVRDVLQKPFARSDLIRLL